MKIDWIDLDDGKCRVIAEMGNAHNGSLDRALRIVDAAKGAGCEFLKTQAYTASELVALRGDGPAPEPWGSSGWSMRDLYTKAATPFAWFPAIKERCAKNGIVWFSSFFGEESLDMLESLSNPCWKIAALDNDAYGPLAELGRTRLAGKPKLVSTAGTAYNLDPGFTDWLWAPPGYPQTRLELSSIGDEGFRGFSYHGVSIEPPVVAAARGAKLIECHIQLWDEPSELEESVSLTDVQFSEMIRRVHEVEAMLA